MARLRNSLNTCASSCKRRKICQLPKVLFQMTLFYTKISISYSKILYSLDRESVSCDPTLLSQPRQHESMNIDMLSAVTLLLVTKKESLYAFPPFLSTFVFVFLLAEAILFYYFSWPFNWLYIYRQYIYAYIAFGPFADWLYWTIDENTIVISDEDTIFQTMLL